MKKILFVVLLTASNAFALKLGVTAGPHAMIAEEVAKVMQKDYGVKVDIVEFTDFVLPNMALNQGDLDANSFQHQAFLDSQVKDRGFNIISVGKTVLMPLGIYSKKIKGMNDLKEAATIGIPNDPTNGGRALLLLEQAGLLKLKNRNMPSILDISENPKRLKIKELDAPQLPRALDDLDLAVINTDWVILAKLDPKSALMVEGTQSPYANVVATRVSDKENEDIKNLVKAYHSQKIKDFIKSKFSGAILIVD